MFNPGGELIFLSRMPALPLTCRAAPAANPTARDAGPAAQSIHRGTDQMQSRPGMFSEINRAIGNSRLSGN